MFSTQKSDNIDFELMLRKVIEVHTQAILRFYQVQLQCGPIRVFSPEGKVVLVSESEYRSSSLSSFVEVIQGSYHSLRVHLCADEVAIVSIDTRTGRLNLRDTGDLAAAGRGPRFSAISDSLNENPNMLFDALIRLRYNVRVVLFGTNHIPHYCGRQLQISWNKKSIISASNCSGIATLPKKVGIVDSFLFHLLTSVSELQKFGPAARGMMYIQLANFPTHYLVLVLTDEEFRYALISTKVLSDTMLGDMIMEDIGWLDVRRMQGNGPGMDEVVVSSLSLGARVGQKRRDDVPSQIQRSEDK